MSLISKPTSVKKKFCVNSTDISGKVIWQGKKYQDLGGLKWEDDGVTTSGQVVWLIDEVADDGTSDSW